jgi:hypothetical protein
MPAVWKDFLFKFKNTIKRVGGDENEKEKSEKKGHQVSVLVNGPVV